MPSHIFTRVGYWRDSVESNRQSARIDGDKTFEQPARVRLHGLRPAAARPGSRPPPRCWRTRAAWPPRPTTSPRAYAYAAMPARIALERGAWAEAAKLTLDPAADAYPWKKYPQAEAVNAFARGVGAAMSGDAAAAADRGRAAAGAPRRRGGAEDRLLGRADRHPGRGRARPGQLRRRQVRRVRGDAAGRRRPRGRHREARRHAGPDRACARGAGAWCFSRTARPSRRCEDSSRC